MMIGLINFTKFAFQMNRSIGSIAQLSMKFFVPKDQLCTCTASLPYS